VTSSVSNCKAYSRDSYSNATFLQHSSCHVAFWNICTGLDDKTLLPNYPYRDDAQDIWNAIRTYVSNVVKHFYKSDAVSETISTTVSHTRWLFHFENIIIILRIYAVHLQNILSGCFR